MALFYQSSGIYVAYSFGFLFFHGRYEYIVNKKSRYHQQKYTFSSHLPAFSLLSNNQPINTGLSLSITLLIAPLRLLSFIETGFN